MNTITESHKDFPTFAANFRQENPDILQMWQNHTDPLRRAVARIIMEAQA